MTLTTRPMEPNDVPDCTRILNHIIDLGGSTAYEEPYSEAHFDAHYRQEPPISMVVLSDGKVVGFQGLFEIEPGIYSIGSFTDRQNPVKGAGAVMFDASLTAARKRGGTAILAKITSDNTGGLTYYDRMGFVDYEVLKADHVRSDGTVVDRIAKRFLL